MNDILPMRAAFAGPDVTMVARMKNEGGWMTAVTRLWPRGVDYCGLCPRDRCSLHRGACLVVVEGRLTTDEAERLSTHDRPWFDDRGAGIGAGISEPHIDTRSGA